MPLLYTIVLFVFLSGPQREHATYLDDTDARWTEVFQAIKAIIQEHAFEVGVIELGETIGFTKTCDNREATEDEYLDPG